MKKNFFLSLTILLMLGIFIQAQAQIGISPVIVDFTADQPLAQNILVQNSGSNTAYVNVTPYVVQNPGTKQEKQVRIYNPSVSGILVSPSSLVIPAGQQRYVRIMLTKSLGNTDRMYRVNFIPEIAGLETTQIIKGKELGLHIIVGYGALITARPQNLMPTISFSRQRQALHIKNTGNTNLFITATQCNSKSHCIKLISDRLYAGNQWQIKLPYLTAVSINTRWLNSVKKYSIK